MREKKRDQQSVKSLTLHSKNQLPSWGQCPPTLPPASPSPSTWHPLSTSSLARLPLPVAIHLACRLPPLNHVLSRLLVLPGPPPPHAPPRSMQPTTYNDTSVYFYMSWNFFLFPYSGFWFPLFVSYYYTSWTTLSFTCRLVHSTGIYGVWRNHIFFTLPTISLSISLYILLLASSSSS